MALIVISLILGTVILGGATTYTMHKIYRRGYGIMLANARHHSPDIELRSMVIVKTPERALLRDRSNKPLPHSATSISLDGSSQWSDGDPDAAESSSYGGTPIRVLGRANTTVGTSMSSHNGNSNVGTSMSLQNESNNVDKMKTESAKLGPLGRRTGLDDDDAWTDVDYRDESTANGFDFGFGTGGAQEDRKKRAKEFGTV